ncbi:Na+ channel, amiloride-sensitive family and Degenerin family-containing protein [Aphelenchoides bicaudatus]|nr:Na+ channel, amiloride-sensitive family and Degenerin family-containing protein [Aphelenchoides bicaudatus]
MGFSAKRRHIIDSNFLNWTECIFSAVFEKRRIGSTASAISAPSAFPHHRPYRPSVASTRSVRILPPPAPVLREPSIEPEEKEKIRYYRRNTNRVNRSLQGPRTFHSVKDVLYDFCARTSSHGIPLIGTHSFFGPYVWSFITSIAFITFCTQTYLTMKDYFTFRTIIEMQLKFEPAPFPAATLCNLNAFKSSELRKFEEFEQGFLLYERAVSHHVNDSAVDAVLSRRKRHVVYQPVYVKCACMSDDKCVPQRNPLETNFTICICYEDAQTGDAWPCYPATAFSAKTCMYCTNSQTCEDPDRPPNITSLLDDPVPRECICQSVSHHCMLKDDADEIKWWDPERYSIYPATEPPTTSPEINDMFGAISELKDRGAITTKTKENLIFMVATLPREVRQSLSYNLKEFVLRCSFNSEDCDIERDFQLHMDPEFGNCWTFNFNDSVELKNSRAGPMYGLRLLLNVNQSDYLPTTEAAGVRLVVHEQDQEPFPDTFGYSAPTGFVSSFGLKTKRLERRDQPYGDCSDIFRPENYIYAEHYSPEGCYRNCFQQIIIKRCECGDPRFPLPTENDRTCDVRNTRDRLCLLNQTSVLGGFHHLTHDCQCVQPCTENVFETAYSAAAWPAINFNIGADCDDVDITLNDTAACAEYYRLNTAFIEIFYEQLNYETLKETPAYTLVNLFSDLGGNIGLCIGFSLITFLEVAEVLCELCWFGARKPRQLIRERRRLRQKRLEDEQELESYLNSSPSQPYKFGALGHSADSPSNKGHLLYHYGMTRQPGTTQRPRFRLTQHRFPERPTKFELIGGTFAEQLQFGHN